MTEENIIVNEPSAIPGREFHIFNSFEEQQEYNSKEMAKLSPLECLQHLRKCINTAYGMHGYNPAQLPVKHDIHFG